MSPNGSPEATVAHGLQEWIGMSSDGLSNWLGAARRKYGFSTNMVLDPEEQQVGLSVTF